MIRSRKVTILGNGHVGSHCAYALAMQSVCEEIVTVDVNGEKNTANAYDVCDGISFFPNRAVVRAGSFADCEDADVIVVSIGQPREPGQTRLDVLDVSIRMLRKMLAELAKLTLPEDVVIITITNPADVIAFCTREALGLPRTRVFSTGTSLDTARMKRALSEFLELDPRSLTAFCLGEHGESSMIPFSSLTAGGRHWREFIADRPAYYLEKLRTLKPEQYGSLEQDGLYAAIEEYILDRTHAIGNIIIDGKGSTEFGIGTALADMVKAVVHDEHRVLPASVLLEGEYGNSGMHNGVPCVIGAKGIEQIVPLRLTAEEQAAFDRSCETMATHIRRVETIE